MSKPATDRHTTFVDWLRTTFPKLWEKHYKNLKPSIVQKFKPLEKVQTSTEVGLILPEQ